MSIQEHYTNELQKIWLRTIEDFARSVGINETNAHECELQQHQPMKAELYRNGQHLATFEATIEGHEFTVKTISANRT